MPPSAAGAVVALQGAGATRQRRRRVGRGGKEGAAVPSAPTDKQRTLLERLARRRGAGKGGGSIVQHRRRERTVTETLAWDEANHGRRSRQRQGGGWRGTSAGEERNLMEEEAGVVSGGCGAVDDTSGLADQ